MNRLIVLSTVVFLFAVLPVAGGVISPDVAILGSALGLTGGAGTGCLGACDTAYSENYEDLGWTVDVTVGNRTFVDGSLLRFEPTAVVDFVCGSAPCSSTVWWVGSTSAIVFVSYSFSSSLPGLFRVSDDEKVVYLKTGFGLTPAAGWSAASAGSNEFLVWTRTFNHDYSFESVQGRQTGDGFASAQVPTYQLRMVAGSQIIQNPEPATWGIVISGLATLALRRRFTRSSMNH